jgi:hypothetical protein
LFLELLVHFINRVLPEAEAHKRGFCKQQGTYALDGRLLVKKPTPQRQEANVKEIIQA